MIRDWVWIKGYQPSDDEVKIMAMYCSFADSFGFTPEQVNDLSLVQIEAYQIYLKEKQAKEIKEAEDIGRR